MKIRDLKEILEGIGAVPKRSLGQNFLLDKNFARRVVDLLELEGGELVLEVGPGVGAITEHIVQSQAGKILLLEKDDKIIVYLKKRFSEDKRVEVLCEDALKWDIRKLYCGLRVFLVGGLPYNVATPLLMRYGAVDSPVERMVIIVQEEVAERICAQPFSKHYGGWTVLFGRRWKGEIISRLKPDAFCPRPRVMSAVVRLERRPNREIIRCDGGDLERLVWAGFSNRRKQLRKQLGCERELWNSLSEELGFSPEARAEELSIEQWQKLASRLG
ncbi:MAG: 16S rRNA (adenine(1518)-N(6)/adenine(1519)-N(6))-dimethyltransferase RsmA, partial [Chthoniobacterales bacterium]|nr:16S rRNA (adenine(1518)-N(6)/adenine(1519)-N(6))-dimethyltransferase RsmA [Chthoniobacterales bacterium]